MKAETGPAIVVIEGAAYEAEEVDGIVGAEAKGDVRRTDMIGEDETAGKAPGGDAVDLVLRTRE
ncbi:hypothetical protein, partial [Bradyrhizobium cosmicum]|uniref:hypothetical protein n=1 Tax=Bradyrhizobium cosmicum TaxID=1404864 RepID=UPI0028EF9508